jgi:hypothetical protein
LAARVVEQTRAADLGDVASIEGVGRRCFRARRCRGAEDEPTVSG